MMSPSSTRVGLAQSVSWAVVGNVFFAICQWGAVVLLARMGSVEVLGRFALALALTAPVFLLASLNLRIIQATDAQERFRFPDYVALRMVATTVALVTVVFMAIVRPDSSGTSATIVLIGVAKAFEGVSDVCYGYHQRLERMDRVARSLMLRGAAGLVGIMIGLGVAGTSSAAAAGMATAWCAVVLLYDVQVVSSRTSGRDAGAKSRSWNASRVLALARLSLPLGVVLMLVSLQANIPRYIVEAHGGNKGLGVFAALSSFLAVGSVLVNALGQSAAPGMARRFAGGHYTHFLRFVAGVSAIAIAIGAVGWLVAVLAGAGVLNLVLGAQFRPYSRELSWLMAAGVVAGLASALGYAMTAARQMRVQVPVLLGVCITVAAASYVLVPQHGILGAAWALGAGFLFQVLGSLAVLWKSAP